MSWCETAHRCCVRTPSDPRSGEARGETQKTGSESAHDVPRRPITPGIGGTESTVEEHRDGEHHELREQDGDGREDPTSDGSSLQYGQEEEDEREGAHVDDVAVDEWEGGDEEEFSEHAHADHILTLEPDPEERGCSDVRQGNE